MSNRRIHFVQLNR